jgi:hypothetical protein
VPPPPTRKSPNAPPPPRPTTSNVTHTTPNNASLQTVLEFLKKCPGFLSQIEPDPQRNSALKNALSTLESCLSQNMMNPQDLQMLNQAVSYIYSNNLQQADSSVKNILSR